MIVLVIGFLLNLVLALFTWDREGNEPFMDAFLEMSGYCIMAVLVMAGIALMVILSMIIIGLALIGLVIGAFLLYFFLVDQ